MYFWKTRLCGVLLEETVNLYSNLMSGFVLYIRNSKHVKGQITVASRKSFFHKDIGLYVLNADIKTVSHIRVSGNPNFGNFSLVD